ncbi:Bifunctional solanapyrone synthase [Talaromyces pinophilus]|nr:Bifunctional solanapyrone synthase [Talaromyces pinophilus]
MGLHQVIEYELVLASGKIVDVNNDSYPDLFLALKGGGNNFGIVTRYTLKTFPLGNFWGGFLAYPITAIDQQIDALSTFLGTEPFDPHAAMIKSWGYTSGRTIISDGEYYTPDVQSTPAVYQNYINGSALLRSTLRTSNMSSLVAETDAYKSYNMRQGYYTTSFLHTHSIYSLKPSSARLVNVLHMAYWSSASDDTTLISSIKIATRVAGVYQAYKYYNYADKSRDVISGYGSASVAEEVRCIWFVPEQCSGWL